MKACRLQSTHRFRACAHREPESSLTKLSEELRLLSAAAATRKPEDTDHEEADRLADGACFMGADSIGAESTPHSRGSGASVLLCLKESSTERLHT